MKVMRVTQLMSKFLGTMYFVLVKYEYDSRVFPLLAYFEAARATIGVVLVHVLYEHEYEYVC